MTKRSILDALASAFMAGEQTAEQIILRSTTTLGKDWRWIHPLARRYLRAFAGKISPRHRDVVAFLIHDKVFKRVASKNIRHLHVAHWLTEAQAMRPAPAAEQWDIPVIESVGALAEWLGLDAGELSWFADLKGLGYRTMSSPVSHYNYRVIAKRSGGLRLVESPKPRLKAIQQKILRYILDKIPPHHHAHGFVKHKSINTFAAPHAHKQVVLRLDLQDFFPSFRAARVQTIFRVLGYPESVADNLGGICTNATPHYVWKSTVIEDHQLLREAQDLYRRPHLPQGAPTSPALANICTYRADCRVSALAEAAGAEYTRYADDLAFSGGLEFAKGVQRFSIHVAAILLEEGFRVNHHKTRIMRSGVRQHLAGVVVNEHPNVRRDDFDRLKAILTNCVRSGAKSQNRNSHPHFRLHLQGRIAFLRMLNPNKANRLQVLFEKIQW
jgi:RNA-directed DNA polymerase